MIYLEHLNLVVKDIPAALTFYQAAFPHWFIRSQGQSDWYGKPRDWLHFGDDYQYITFNNNGENNNRDLTGHQVGLAHFAFVTNNIEQVINRLAKAGFAIHKPGAEEPYRKNVYFVDPDGFEIEFIQYLSDLPAERNLD
ncbi:VOC family protein [Thalassotalea castellviae]|uniref:VOC family protein n=1 Tax=Thalassotalea castellviae TaxID=3075612 RepID=A0ABU3A1Y6_9GAMM|nr:VOC family protein [Thalassotalea sp. W431]MDT0604196.1 VOC family protein [Thalassotalea sp. W431]